MKPSLNILTSLLRTEFLDEVVSSFTPLHEFFAVDWIPVVCGKSMSIGAAWNYAASKVSDPAAWCILLDDDNFIHPGFARPLYEGIVSHPDVNIFTLRQYNADGSPRFTFHPRLAWGGIDAAQLVFRKGVVDLIPFPDTSAGINAPDGRWIETVAARLNERIVQLEVPTFYNGCRR